MVYKIVGRQENLQEIYNLYRHGNKDILCITNDADNHSRYVFTAVPHLARIYDERLCISAYMLDSRRPYPVQTT